MRAITDCFAFILRVFFSDRRAGQGPGQGLGRPDANPPADDDEAAVEESGSDGMPELQTPTPEEEAPDNPIINITPHMDQAADNFAAAA